jgi:uncharacterized protein YukE
MAESFAGITVPEGEPDTIRDAASTFHGVAGGLHGASSDLRSVPGLVSDWKGPASAAFGSTVVTNGSCVDDAAQAMSTCAQAARTYAYELEQAQKDARQAIADARDAQDRIDKARSDLESALGAETDASNRMSSAGSRLSSGVPDPSASADYDNASNDLATAQNAASDARRRLEQAQADLEAAQRRGHQAEKAAKDAARAAANAFDGVAGHSPAAAVFGGSPTAIEHEVLARVRAGDYSVLDEVAFNYLPKDTQRAIAAEIAEESLKASYGEGSHTIQQMAGVVRHFEHDDEFATGFYNQLGGGGARELITDLVIFNGTGHGLKDPSLVAIMAPFATMLGTATRSRDLESNFTDDFIGDAPIRDRIPGHLHLAAFIMAGVATNYSGSFLSRVGKEILVDSQNTAEGAPPFVELSDYQDFMQFMAGNHEAAGTLLAGHYGEAGLSNVIPLLQYGPRWTDDGNALGALIQAGTHDLRMDGNITVSNDAAHAVIQGVPTWHETIPDGAKPALVQILDDHVVDFEYAATHQVDASSIALPDGAIDLRYDDAQNYVQALVADDHMRKPATTIIGERVAYDIDQATVTDNPRYAQRAGALSEMSVIATHEADLDGAKQADAMNNLANTATGKLIGFTPTSKAVKTVVGFAFKDLFSTDHVHHVLEHQTREQMNAFGAIKRLSVVSQVQHGNLPEQVMGTMKPDGTMDLDFVGNVAGHDDVVRSSADGVSGEPLSFDFNHNNRIDPGETNITENELYLKATGNSEVASDAMRSLHDIQWDGTHPPDLDDLPLPDDLHHDNANIFERILPGDDRSISDGSGEVAHQGDLRWDPDQHVYTLPVETGDGATSELHYMRYGDNWELVHKVGDKWVRGG